MTNSKRRSFLKLAAVGATGTMTAAPAVAAPAAVKWRLVSSFPRNLDTIFGGAEYLADRVRRLTDGKFDISVSAAGEVVPGLKVMDAVQQGTAECGHSASVYYVGKNRVFAFDSTVPFGLTCRQQNAWMYYGGGLKLMRDLFADFNIINFPGGNTGTQMGGWFRNEIKSLNDLKGVKFRIPGMGGEVMARLGVATQVLPGEDIFRALEKGTIDATEWVGPYDDEKLGFYKLVKNYYYPGWWEPAPQLSFYVNTREWAKLPMQYREAFTSAAAEVNINMVAEYDFKNPQAVVRLLGYGVKLHAYPADVMSAAYRTAFDLYDEEAEKNPAFRKVYEEWSRFRSQIQGWFKLAEFTMERALYAGSARR